VPVVQLQDDTGANLGSALGAAAGYFATQKQRKADKATATARQAELDKQNTQKNQDYHDEVTSKIQEAAGQDARTKENDVNAQFQQAANAKALNLLGSSPQGQDPAQWAQSVWTKATTPPSSGGLGLTDSKMLAELNTQVQAAVAKATQAKQQKFIQGEQVLPSDPKQALGVLGKRQQIEGGQGIDPKRTQDAITAAQKQITEAQAAAYQNANLAERKHHDLAVENRPQRPSHFGEVTPAQQHQWDLEDKRFGIEQKRFDAEFPGGKKPGSTKETTPQARGADYTAAATAIQKGADRDSVVKRFAAKWQLAPDKADALFP